MKRLLYLIPVFIHRVTGWLPFQPKPGKVSFANVGEGTHGEGIKTYLSDAAQTSHYLLYKVGTDADHCTVMGTGDTTVYPLGPSEDQADASGQLIAIQLLGAVKGTVRMITDGTISNGNRVKASTNTAGYVMAANSTDISFGIAIIGTDTTTAAGDVIEVIPCIPQKYVF